MKQLQILDMNALAVRTKHFAIPAGDPHPGSCKVQVSNRALCPAVDSGSPVAASVTDGLKALVERSRYAAEKNRKSVYTPIVAQFRVPIEKECTP